jgi:hypothetical protein
MEVPARIGKALSVRGDFRQQSLSLEMSARISE